MAGELVGIRGGAIPRTPGAPASPLSRLQASGLGKRINPQDMGYSGGGGGGSGFGWGGFSGAGPIGGSGGFGAFGSGHRGPRLRETPPLVPPEIMGGKAHNALNWLASHAGRGDQWRNRLEVSDANDLIRSARRGYLGFSPYGGSQVVNLDPSHPMYGHPEGGPAQFGWQNFGADPTKPRQMAHAQKAMEILRGIQAKGVAARGGAYGAGRADWGGATV